MNLDASQESAVKHALGDGKLLVVAGGAGTGKTTIIKEILKRMKTGTLLAPTGKAAARLREASGLSASTIHSYLRYQGEGFGRDPKSDPITEPVIIDEASMIDSALMATLLRYKPPKIILVGDPAQLPPVGRGQPFHDICSRMPERVSILTTCHRAKGAVHHAAREIRAGNCPGWNQESDGESFKILDTGLEYPTQQLFVRDYVKAGKFDPAQDVVLAARNGEPKKAAEEVPGTVKGLNHVIVQIVNPRDPGETWRVGDRVMNLKNNATLDWYNGDVGEITSIDTRKNLWVLGDRGEEMRLDAEARRNIIHAYAMTVHKSQGSQYRDVYVFCHVSSSRMLNRNLIYTAVTRARRSVTILGQPGAFYSSLACVPFRMTALQQLIERDAMESIPG